jgi:CRP/FNR family transcriptional regulator
VKSPYGLEIIESCQSCTERGKYLFCNLPDSLIKQLDTITSTATYPRGAMLFMEGQEPRGVFVLCHGRAKLSTSSPDGRTVILRIAEPGELLGLSATIAGRPYDTTAELLEPAQTKYIPRETFLKFLRQNGEAAVRVAQQLSSNYHAACQEIRALGLSSSASEKLARLLLEWSAQHPNHAPAEGGIRMNVNLTHQEIAQLIGSSRETVTRMFADFKKKKLIDVKGATLVIRNKSALERLVSHQ